MFVNLSNHPSTNWSEAQAASAREIGGEIHDISFPEIPGSWDTSQVTCLAEELANRIFALSPEAVMVQGEATAVYWIVRDLCCKGVLCYAATSRRVAHMVSTFEGATVKQSEFEFVRFRRYEK
jgi:hypothetical protein